MAGLARGADRTQDVSLNIKLNVGGLGRSLRIVAGLALIGLAGADTAGAWGWIGWVPLLKGVVGFCPACSPLALNSCAMRKA